MSSLSIRNMNRTVDELERIRDRQIAELPRSREESYYWHIERKTKQGWKYQRDLQGTKREAASLFLKFGHGYRLRCLLKY